MAEAYYRGVGDHDLALHRAEGAIPVYKDLGTKLGQAMRLATVATTAERTCREG